MWESRWVGWATRCHTLQISVTSPNSLIATVEHIHKWSNEGWWNIGQSPRRVLIEWTARTTSGMSATAAAIGRSSFSRTCIMIFACDLIHSRPTFFISTGFSAVYSLFSWSYFQTAIKCLWVLYFVWLLNSKMGETFTFECWLSSLTTL